MPWVNIIRTNRQLLECGNNVTKRLLEHANSVVNRRNLIESDGGCDLVAGENFLNLRSQLKPKQTVCTYVAQNLSPCRREIIADRTFQGLINSREGVAYLLLVLRLIWLIDLVLQAAYELFQTRTYLKIEKAVLRRSSQRPGSPSGSQNSQGNDGFTITHVCAGHRHPGLQSILR